MTKSTQGTMSAKYHTFLTSIPDVGQWSALRPGLYIPRQRAVRSHFAKTAWAPSPVYTRLRQKSVPQPGSEAQLPRHLIRSLVTILTELPSYVNS